VSGRPEQRPPSDSIWTDDQLDRLIEDELSTRIEAPDMTRAIMGRLGYMRVTEETIKQRRRVKWMRRFATAACLGLVVFAGLLVHRHSADSRNPMGPTIPAALHESLEYGGQQLDRAIESIRMFDFMPQREERSSQPDVIRQHRPELQRGNQPPFRWV